MPTTRQIGPWSAAAALALLGLVACGPETADSLLTRQAVLDPPALWFAQALGRDGAVTGAIFVCADSKLSDGFSRANAEVDGQACLVQGEPVESPGLYVARCDADGRRYSLTVSRQGDPGRDLRVVFALRPLDVDGSAALRITRYRRQGACPSGWRIGDQARPGQRPGDNALGS